MSTARLVYGFHAVTARMRQDPKTVRELFVDVSRRDKRMLDFVRSAEEQGIRVVSADARRLQGMVGHDRHQGVAALADPIALTHSLDDRLDEIEGDPFVLVLDGVTDPHNLGACLRVADGAGAHAVVAPKDRASGLNATASKVASGAAESVPYITVTNLARTLREMQERGIRVIGAADETERSLYDEDLSGPIAWVLGAEGEGMRRLTRETCDVLVRIPMAGAVESLNVSVASAVCLFETARQRTQAGKKRR